MIQFCPGYVYTFTSCLDRKNQILAVAAVREGNEISFVKPSELIVGEITAIEGRETTCVNIGGLDYFSSSAVKGSPFMSAKILEQIAEERKRRGECRW